MTIFELGVKECSACGKASPVDDIDVEYSKRMFPDMIPQSAAWFCHDCVRKKLQLGFWMWDVLTGGRPQSHGIRVWLLREFFKAAFPKFEAK